MIIDRKSHDGSVSTASSSERKLYIELPNPRQIYTAGSDVTGIVHLGSKDLERTLEIKVSLVCVVRSMHHKYYGGNSHDVRRETNNLVHRDHVLWSSSSGEGCSPPSADFPFTITIPDVGNDVKAKDPNADLPPSFEGGARRGWRNFGTHLSSIGFVKYHVKVVVTKQGTFTLNSKARRPFIFFPPSPPPPLFPELPTSTLKEPLSEDLWKDHTATKNLRHHVFSKNGKAELRLWLPRVPHLPRLARIPFLLCFTIMTQPTTGAVGGLPSQDVLPPAAQTGKATLILRKNIHTCARGGKQSHEHNLDAEPTDNLLYSLVPEEGEWTPKTINESGTEMGCWEKRYVWRGMWTCKETPSFVNRQITCEYALVAEVPIKGLGNGMKLVTPPIEITSGVTAGTDPSLSVQADELDFPPAYFEPDGAMNDDDEGSEDEKSRDRKH